MTRKQKIIMITLFFLNTSVFAMEMSKTQNETVPMKSLTVELLELISRDIIKVSENLGQAIKNFKNFAQVLALSQKINLLDRDYKKAEIIDLFSERFMTPSYIVAKRLGIELTDELKKEIKEKAITRILNRHSISHNELETWFDEHRDFSNNPFRKFIAKRFTNDIDQRKTLIEMAVALIYTDAKPDFKIEGGKTSLMVAAMYRYKGLKDIVELLLNCGANPNMREEDGHTALMWAAFIGNKDIVELLLNAGADPNIQDKDGSTALMGGIFYWHKKIIVELFLSGGADLNIMNEEEFIIESLSVGERGMVKCFLNVGIALNLNLQDRNDCTILMKKISNRYKNIVELLLNAGADPNLQDKNGRTALIKAAYKEHEDIVELLLNAGADPNIQDDRIAL